MVAYSFLDHPHSLAWHNHDPRPLLALDTFHGSPRRRGYRRGLELESTAATPSSLALGALTFLRDLQEKREPTSGRFFISEAAYSPGGSPTAFWGNTSHVDASTTYRSRPRRYCPA